MNLQSITLSKRSQTQKFTYCMILFYKIYNLGKSTDTESRLVVARGWGKEECEVTAQWVLSFICRWWKCFETTDRWLCNTVNILNATDFFSLKWLVLCEFHLIKNYLCIQIYIYIIYTHTYTLSHKYEKETKNRRNTKMINLNSIITKTSLSHLQ